MIVSRHVDQPVARKVEEDRARLAFLLRLLRLTDGGGDGVGRLGCRDDAFRLGEESGGFERFKLRNVDGVHQAILLQLADDGARAVVTQSAGVDMCRSEGVAERVHGDERRVTRLIAEVVLEAAARQLRARGRFGGYDTQRAPFGQLMPQEGERQSGEVRSAAKAGDHHVRIFASHLHLLLCLQPDHRLVERHMVEHTAQHILAIWRLHGQLYGLRDSRPKAALIRRMIRQDLPPRLRAHTRRGDDLRAECLHDGASVRLLVVAHLDHVDGQLQPEGLRGVRHGGAPLACARLGGDVRHALLPTEVGLRDG